MEKKIEKIFFGSEIIAFELVALNTRFYWENILVIGCQYAKKSVKISDTSKKMLKGLISFESYQKMTQKHCRADLSSVSDPLTCWLCISVLIRGFWAFK